MRGTVDEVVFDRFVAAISGFPPRGRRGRTAESVFAESYLALKQLASETPAFPRAIAWRGYALALSVLEGWNFKSAPDEQAMSDTARLELANTLTQDALSLDEFDHDLWWARADVLLIRRDYANAASAFERAVELNRDEANPTLLAEAADAMILIGDHEKADTLLSRSLRRPDWFAWVQAHALFMKAGRLSRSGVPDQLKREELPLLDRSIAKLKKTFAQPGDAAYLSDMQLLLGAIQARRAELLQGFGKSDLADWARAESKAAVERFRSALETRDENKIVSNPPYQDPDDAAYWSVNVQQALSFAGDASGR